MEATLINVAIVTLTIFGTIVGAISLVCYFADKEVFMQTVFPKKRQYKLQEEQIYNHDTGKYESTGCILLIEKILWYEHIVSNTTEYKTLKLLIEEKDELEKEVVRKKDKKPKYQYRDIPEDEITLDRLGDK